MPFDQKQGMAAGPSGPAAVDDQNCCFSPADITLPRGSWTMGSKPRFNCAKGGFLSVMLTTPMLSWVSPSPISPSSVTLYSRSNVFCYLLSLCVMPVLSFS